MRRALIIKWFIRLAIVGLGILIGYLIQPLVVQPYVGSVLNGTNQFLAESQRIAYIDVNSDSISEEFIYYHLSDNRQPIVNQYSATGDFQKAWYLEGEVVENFDFISGDYNRDGNLEVFVFSFNKNSLWLNGLSIGNISHQLETGIPVVNFNQPISTSQLVIHAGGIADLNKDGYGEVIFSVNNRFAESPHKVFAYDIYNNQLQVSPEFDQQLVGDPVLYDINEDGFPEIFLSTFNSTNQAWIPNKGQSINSASVVLRGDLSYYYPPVNLEKRMSVTATYPFKNDTANHIVSISWLLDRETQSDLVLMDSQGRVLAQRKIDENSFVFDSKRSDWSKIQFISRNGFIFTYDSNLEIVEKFDLKGIVNQGNYIDVDLDGEEELVIVQNNKLVILRNDLSQQVVYDLPGLNVQKVLYSVKKDFVNGHKLSIQNQNQQYLITYEKNGFYWIYLLVYLAVIFVLYGIYSLLIWFHNSTVHRIRTENEIFFESHSEMIRNQLDPHFLFNALNSIGFSINKDERKTAYHNLGLFSKFLRESIISLDVYTRTIEQEIEYTTNYLALEKFRFKDKFDYNFMIGPGINLSQKVPKLILFSYVESALKKGVLAKEIPGFIKITIDKFESRGIFISVADDGIFRNIAHTQTTFTKNMVLMDQLVSKCNKNNKNKITLVLNDLGTKEHSKGSHVEITIPPEYQYIF